MNSCPPALLEWQGLSVPVALQKPYRNWQDNKKGCQRCGRMSHLTKDYYANTDCYERPIHGSKSEYETEFEIEDVEPRQAMDSNSCFHCGRHWY
jgi:hypothetical protein